MGYFRDIKYQQEIKTYRYYIKGHEDNTAIVKNKLNELYQLMKDIAPLYADKNRNLDDAYRCFVVQLNLIERSAPLSFILDYNLDFDSSKEIVRKHKIKNENELDILEYIVHLGRCEIATSFLNSSNKEVDISKKNLTGKCSKISHYVKDECKRLGIPAKVCVISPAFYEEENVFEYGKNHAFVMITIGKRTFIVDLTYSQFFHMHDNNLNRLGIPFLDCCAPGAYMMLDEKRKKFAKDLLEKGYFEATDENIKMYFDGFAISFRNGLYYEDLKSAIYETEYTASDYLNFIEGNDSQYNHEEREYLGRQKKILLKPDFSFVPKR